MKKFIVLSALVAATSTAFVACSSDDDLAQQPKAPETIVDNGSSKGTPFSVNPSSGATRAVRYGSSAWGNYDSEHPTNFVDCFKLYGKQSGLDAWINNVVFTRAKTGAEANIWGPSLTQSTPVASLSWPSGYTTGESPIKKSEVATNFYAITDNNIFAGNHATKPDGIDGVSQWMNTEGSFGYSLQTTHATIPWDNSQSNPGEISDQDITFIDRANIRDLMYATTTKKEADVTSGQLPLAFHHALSGLSIQAKFLSNGEYKTDASKNGYAMIKAVAICGLNTSGTFTMNPSTGLGAWSGLGTKVNYYYAIPDAGGRKISVENDQDADVVANPTITELVPAGEWLMVPQEISTSATADVTPWDYSYSGVLPDASSFAYIVVILADKKELDTDFTLCFPLNTKLNAGKNRVITIDIAQGRYASWDFDDDNVSDLFYEPSTIVTSRQFDFGEEF